MMTPRLQVSTCGPYHVTLCIKISGATYLRRSWPDKERRRAQHGEACPARRTASAAQAAAVAVAVTAHPGVPQDVVRSWNDEKRLAKPKSAILTTAPGPLEDSSKFSNCGRPRVEGGDARA